MEMRRELVAGFVARNLCLPLKCVWKRIRPANSFFFFFFLKKKQKKKTEINSNHPQDAWGSTGSRRRVVSCAVFFWKKKKIKSNQIKSSVWEPWNGDDIEWETCTRAGWRRIPTTGWPRQNRDELNRQNWFCVCEREMYIQRHSRHSKLHQTTHTHTKQHTRVLDRFVLFLLPVGYRRGGDKLLGER